MSHQHTAVVNWGFVDYDCSFQDRGRTTGDPEPKGGPAERERQPQEKAGAECSPEERETRAAQVILS